MLFLKKKTQKNLLLKLNLVGSMFIQSFQSQIILNFSLDPIPASFMDKEVGSMRARSDCSKLL